MQDLPPFLKDELLAIRRQLDEILLSQSALRPLLAQINQLVEGQVSMQSTLGRLQEAVGSSRPIRKSTNQNGIMARNVVDQACSGMSTMTSWGGNVVENVVDEIRTGAEFATKPVSAEPPPDSSKKSIRRSSTFARMVDLRMRKRLSRVFEVGEEDERLEKERSSIPFMTRFLHSAALQTDMLDAIALTMILLNILMMGIRIDDAENEGGYVKFDILFALVFIVELCLRLKMNGFAGQFCGSDALPRIFDALIIICDAILVTFELFGIKLTESTLSASIFRIVRLGRFIRLIRVLKTNKFSDLLGMMHGIVGGLHTLAWAAVLFIMMMYVAALICREALGKREEENVFEYFNTVPRSMLTIFRCSFGDCSSSGGVPIFEHVFLAYGGAYAFLYCLFVFSVAIGLFNVISAIFVDGAMSAAADANEKKKQACLASETLMSVNVATLIKLMVADAIPELGVIAKMCDADAMDRILNLEVERAVIDKVVHHPAAVDALNKLDIDPHDHDKLSDILDPDHGGTIGVLDLMNGLQRLRGDPRRSDIISVNLMIRSLQDKVEDVLSRVTHLSDQPVK